MNYFKVCSEHSEDDNNLSFDTKIRDATSKVDLSDFEDKSEDFSCLASQKIKMLETKLHQ